MRSASTLADGARIVDIPDRGRGIVATRALPAGTCLFTEFPLVAMQHGANARAGVSVCECCFRFIGPLEMQVKGLLFSRGRSGDCAFERLPAVPGMYELPLPVSCPGGCQLRFCSEACATQTYMEQHRLLCPGRAGAKDATACGAAATTLDEELPRPPPCAPPASLIEERLAGLELHADERGAVAAAATLSSGTVAAPAAPAASAEPVTYSTSTTTTSELTSELTSEVAPAPQLGQLDDSQPEPVSGVAPAMATTLEELPAEPFARFVAHANATNEIFLMAAKAVAYVLCRLETEGTEGYKSAMAHFEGPLWWDAVATPDDVTDEAAFRRTLRELLTESWTLLKPLLAPHAPAQCALLDTPAPYAIIVGAFERRNCAVQVASPVEAYFLAVDAMPEGDAKDGVTKVTAPLLDALDAAYSTPCDGTGIFPMQATLNHSCEPNVTLLKEEGAEERDGRVVARLMRDVAAGEELCNAYVDISLPVRRRRRELREYGFECDCARCERELKAADEKKATKADGKRRLK